MEKLDLVRKIISLTAENGIRDAIQLVFKEYLMQSFLKLGRFFAFGPVSWIAGLGIDWVLNNLMDFLEDWVKDQITRKLVGEDFDNLREVFKKKDELEKKEVITDVEYYDMDQGIRAASASAFRIGRVQK